MLVASPRVQQIAVAESGFRRRRDCVHGVLEMSIYQNSAARDASGAQEIQFFAKNGFVVNVATRLEAWIFGEIHYICLHSASANSEYRSGSIKSAR